MTLQQLIYIVTLDQERSFVKAAETCFVTQPTLSQQINKLEEELGVLIFDRSKQPIETTDIGKEVVEQARKILKESDNLKALIGEMKGEVSGHLRLGVIPTVAPYLIHRFVAKFLAENPKLSLEIEEKTTSEIVRDLHAGKLDVGILATPIDDNDLLRSVLYYEPFCLYLNPDHPLLEQKQIDEKQLSSDDVLLLTEGHCLRDQALSLCKGRSKVGSTEKQLSMGSGSLDTLTHLVDQGYSYTFIPFLAKDSVKHTKNLRNFKGPVPSREISLVYLPHFRRDGVKKALIAAVQENLPEGVKGLKSQGISKINLKIKTD
ncbi:MAG: LysR substrate-binding domain-containing protein [Bdellovibrionia bacterium]